MNTEIITLQRHIAKLEAHKTMLEKALALQAIRQNEHSRHARVAIVQDDLEAVKSITVRIERNIANNPILVLDFDYDELI